MLLMTKRMPTERHIFNVLSQDNKPCQICSVFQQLARWSVGRLEKMFGATSPHLELAFPLRPSKILMLLLMQEPAATDVITPRHFVLPKAAVESDVPSAKEKEHNGHHIRPVGTPFHLKPVCT